MPLTIAHPAAVIPLFRRMKKYGLLSALIIGSIAPDFTYFLFLPITRGQTHSLAGLFWFCLPMGLLVYFVFHGLMKRPLLSLLPAQLTMRLEPNGKEETRPWNSNLLPACVSILVGAATHLLWDSFTHKYDFAVQTFPFLQTRLFTLFGYDVFLFKVLQHGSSVIGITLLMLWTIQWFRNTAVSRPPSEAVTLPLRHRLFWVGFIVFFAVIAGMFGGYYFAFIENEDSILHEFVRGMAISSFSAVGGLLLMYSIIYWTLRLQTQRQVE